MSRRSFEDFRIFASKTAAYIPQATSLFKRKQLMKVVEPNDEEEPDEDKIMRDIIDSLAALVRIQSFKGTFMKTARSKSFFAAVSATFSSDSVHQAFDQDKLIISQFHACFPGEYNSIGSSDTNLGIWHPLHWASMSINFSSDDLKALIDDDPESLLRVDCEQQKATAGHYAVSVSKPSLSTIKILAVSSPRMVFTKDASNRLVLHWAAQYTRSVETLQYLLQLNPAATKAQDTKGYTPLNLLLMRDHFPELLEMARCLAEADPASLLIISNDSGCPLHTAIFRKDEKDIDALVDLLLSINPQSAKIRSKSLRLPLHTACHREDSIPLAVIEKLLSVYEQAVHELDDKQWLPIHWACQWSTVDIIQRLLPLCSAEALPRTATQCVTTMMHRAAARTQNDGCDMIAYIYSIFPESVRIKDGSGQLPLHYATYYGRYFNTVEAVYRLYPAAIKIKDNHRELPLYKVASMKHFEETHGDDMKMLRLLLKEYPQAAGMETNRSYDDDYDTDRKENAYDHVVRRGYPGYVRRLFLLAMPQLDPVELRRLNYLERRGALFVAFAAICASSRSDTFVYGLRKLTQFDGMILFKHVVSYL